MTGHAFFTRAHTQVDIPDDVEPDLTIDEAETAEGANTTIEAADGIEDLIRLQDKLQGAFQTLYSLLGGALFEHTSCTVVAT